MITFKPIVLAVTGASGAPYAVRLLRALVEAKRPVQLIVSHHGWRLLETESAISDVPGLQAATGGAAWKGLVTTFHHRARWAAPASGSVLPPGKGVCPSPIGPLAPTTPRAPPSPIHHA